MKIKYNGMLNRFNRFVCRKFSDRAWNNPFSHEYGEWYTGKKCTKSMTVCEYFWRTVWNIVRTIIALWVGFLFSLFLIISPMVFIYQFFSGSFSGDNNFAVVGLSTIISYILIVIWFGSFHLIMKTKGFLTNKNPKPKKDSLIKEYFLAKKNKFCKMVDVVND